MRQIKILARMMAKKLHQQNQISACKCQMLITKKQLKIYSLINISKLLKVLQKSGNDL